MKVAQFCLILGKQAVLVLDFTKCLMPELTQHHTRLPDPIRLKHQRCPLPLKSQNILLCPLPKPTPGPSAPQGCSLSPSSPTSPTTVQPCFFPTRGRSPVPSTARTGCSATDEKATATASPPPWVPSCLCLGTAGKDPGRCPQRVPSTGPHLQLLWEPPAPFLKDGLLCEVSQPHL